MPELIRGLTVHLGDGVTIPPAPDTPPPGETGVELTGPSALELFAERMRLMTESPRQHHTALSIEAMPLGRWVGLRVVLKGEPQTEVTLRLSKAWAVALVKELQKVVVR